MHNDSFLSICWIECVCVCVSANAPPHTYTYSQSSTTILLNDGQHVKDTQTGNIQVDMVTLRFLAAWWPYWGISDTLTLIPADLCCILMHITTAAASWGEECIIWTPYQLRRIPNVKGVPDKEHVFSHLKWAISSRVNVKEGFGECSPSTSFSLLWGLLLFKTAKNINAGLFKGWRHFLNGILGPYHQVLSED